MKSETLLSELTNMTHDHLSQSEQFATLSEQVLTYKANPESWSILECMEHLNRYGDFYIPEIRNAIESSTKPHEAVFRT